MRPDEGQREQGDHLANTARRAETHRLQTGAARLQGAEERFDLPTAPVALYGLFRVAVCQEEQALRLPLTACIARSHQM